MEPGSQQAISPSSITTLDSWQDALFVNQPEDLVITFTGPETPTTTSSGRCPMIHQLTGSSPEGWPDVMPNSRCHSGCWLPADLGVDAGDFVTTDTY